MTNASAWENYRTYTKDLTSLGRQLGFGAAAVAWVLKLPTGVLNQRLLWALGLTVTFFLLDILQGLIAAIPLRIWLHRREGSLWDSTGTIEGDYSRPRSLDRVPFVLFLLKFAVLLMVYAVLAVEVFSRLGGSEQVGASGRAPAMAGINWNAVSAISTLLLVGCTVAYVWLTHRLSKSAADNIALLQRHANEAQERRDAEIRARALLLHRQLDSWFFDNPDLNDETWKRQVQSQFDVVERRFEELILRSKEASASIAASADEAITHWLRGSHHLNLELKFLATQQLGKLVEWKLAGASELRSCRDALRILCGDDPRTQSLNPSNDLEEMARLAVQAGVP